MSVNTSTVSNVRFSNLLNCKRKSKSVRVLKNKKWFKNKLLSKRFDGMGYKFLSLRRVGVTFYNKKV